MTGRERLPDRRRSETFGFERNAARPTKHPRRTAADDLLDDLIFSPEQIGTGSKKLRGMARKSLDLINAMYEIAEAGRPMTGRGVGYKLFTRRLIRSMAKRQMQRVYRLLKQARERGMIPWVWIVDEGRELEQVPSWANPGEFAEAAAVQYRRDFWNQQPVRVEVWSEKGTVRGVLAPVLKACGVGFRPVGGFSSATKVHDIAEVDISDRRKLIILYVGDWDPSGLCMSERDLPNRLAKYRGYHVEIKRIALTQEQLAPLASFPATDKRKDPRYPWFVQNFGDRCWEVDALDPNALRDRVEQEIRALIDPVAWERCELVNKAERDSLREVLARWSAS